MRASIELRKGSGYLFYYIFMPPLWCLYLKLPSIQHHNYKCCLTTVKQKVEPGLRLAGPSLRRLIYLNQLQSVSFNLGTSPPPPIPPSNQQPNKKSHEPLAPLIKSQCLSLSLPMECWSE